MKTMKRVIQWFLSIALCVSMSGWCEAQGILIPGVPDQQQPIPGSLGNPTFSTCAPVAAANIVEYWESVAMHPHADSLSPGIPATQIADYLCYFMDTGNWGSPVRQNGTSMPPVTGTYSADIQPGFHEFVRWDLNNLFGTFPPPPPQPPPPPPPSLIPGKKGHTWAFSTDYTIGWFVHKTEIDNGRPDVVSFNHWNLVPTGLMVMDPVSGEMVDFYTWGTYTPSSPPSEPDEDWNDQPADASMGHAVTGVGYFENYDPDGMPGGPTPMANWIVCHDNWSSTPRNVAVPFDNHWRSTITADPGQILPIALLTFDVRKAGDRALLKWSTDFGDESVAFHIERKKDTEDAFDLVVTIKAREPADEINHYAYADLLPEARYVLYRLRIEGLDGAAQYSPIRSIGGLSGKADWYLFPNPASDQCNFAGIGLPPGEYRYEVITPSGQTVLSGMVSHGYGPVRLERIETLPKGLYYFRLLESPSGSIRAFIR